MPAARPVGAVTTSSVPSRRMAAKRSPPATPGGMVTKSWSSPGVLTTRFVCVTW